MKKTVFTMLFVLILLSISACSPLHQAVTQKSLQSVQQQVKDGADINEYNSTGFTPLMLAAYHGSSAISQYLVENGAKLDLGSRNGRFTGFTALHFAVYYGHKAIARILVEKGADINAISRTEKFKEFTALHLAVYYENQPIASYLLEKGADIDATCKTTRFYDFTPLHFAAFYGFFEIAKVLVDSGADLTKVDRNGLTAYDYAEKYEFRKVAGYIQKAEKDKAE